MSTIKATNFQHASAANPALVLAADGSATANVSAINGGPLAGFRNAIINGNFNHWQRGTSFAATVGPTYTADRWEVSFNGTGATRTISIQSFALGQTDVPGEPTYFLRFAQSVAGSGATFTQLDQRIEDVRAFAGQQLTISFWAKAAANTTMPNVAFQQLFGTGGSPSGMVSTIAATNIALTTAWQKFSYQASIPSISGKTLGTNNDSCLVVVLSVPINTTFTFDIAQVQVEPGPVATTFERRPIGTEESLCYRYFWKSLPNANAAIHFSGNVTSGSVYEAVSGFPVVMRADPTVAVSNVGVDNFNVGAGTLYISRAGVCEQKTASGSGRGAFISAYTASAEL